MPRKVGRDMTKEQHWRGVVNSWHSSGLTAAEFCRRHGHKYSHFQDWRRIIRKRDAETAAKPRTVIGSKPGRNKHSSRVTSPRQPVPDFVQASITDSARAVPVASNDSKVEVVLPCGTVLRITTTCPPQFLSSVVTALENR
jgi:hypothetical protein